MKTENLTPLFKLRSLNTTGGGSLTLTLPLEICGLFGWKSGDKVRLFVDRESSQILIEKNPSGPIN